MARHPPVHFEPTFVRGPDAGPYTERLARRLGFDRGFPLRQRLNEALGAYVALARRRQPGPGEQSRRLPSVEDKRRRCELLEKTVRAVLDGRRDRIPALEQLLETSGGLALTRRSPLTPHIERAATIERWDAVDNFVLTRVAPRQVDGGRPPHPAPPTNLHHPELALLGACQCEACAAAALALLRQCQAGLAPWSSLTIAPERSGKAKRPPVPFGETHPSRDWSKAALLDLLERVLAEQRQLVRPRKQDRGISELRILLDELRSIWKDATGSSPVHKVLGFADGDGVTRRGYGVPTPESIAFFAFARFVLKKAGLKLVRARRRRDGESFRRREGGTAPFAIYQQFIRIDRRRHRKRAELTRIP